MEGAGIGMLGGLVIGISDADWIRLAIVLALIAYAGNALKTNKPNPAGNSYKYALTGFAAFFALIAGLYLQSHQVFEQSPREAITLLTEAGYSPSQARDIYLKQIEWSNSKQDLPAPSIRSILDAFLFPAEAGSSSDTLKSPETSTDTLGSG